MLDRSEAISASTLKSLITGLAESTAPGPYLSSSVFHLFYALELISGKTGGRTRLAEQLNVGEGVVRTILRRLNGAGLVTTSTVGCALTDEGLRIWRGFENVFPRRAEFLRTALTPSIFNYAFLIRGGSGKVGSGIEQRDAAIVAGALCTLVVVFEGGHLQIKSVCDNVEKAFPNVASEMHRELKPQEDDVIVVAGGETALKARRGAFAASWSLLS